MSKPTRKKPIILPRIPSKLIEIALEDLEKCERDGKYRIAMSSWHEPGFDNCYVCAAGAIMAQRLGASCDQYREPEDFRRNSRQLEAVNFLRIGHCEAACRLLKIKYPSSLPRVAAAVAPYSVNKTRFKRDMRKLAKTLREAGI